MHKNTSPCAIRSVIARTQSRTACCEAKISCPVANSDKESKWLKEKGGETATYILKKKRKEKALFKDYKRQKFG